MNRVLIDTNALIRFLRGDNSVFSVGTPVDGFLLSPVVIGEFLAGISPTRKGQTERKAFEQFMASPRVTVLTLTQKTAAFYARVFSGLKAAGHPLPMNDIWIAAQAMEHGVPVFTYDAHFSAIANLLVITP